MLAQTNSPSVSSMAHLQSHQMVVYFVSLVNSSAAFHIDRVYIQQRCEIPRRVALETAL